MRGAMDSTLVPCAKVHEFNPPLLQCKSLILLRITDFSNYMYFLVFSNLPTETAFFAFFCFDPNIAVRVPIMS